MNKRITKNRPATGSCQKTTEERYLVLINDDEHSFDYVIDTLIEVCGHNYEQAAQCTVITHHKGKCDIKKGPVELLRPMRISLVNRELKAIIS
ncbi:MAG: ATP-dependent Clp protease adaptor ClpS [Prolixibacteraceae bacterium]|nr:ATP-dependent Clp protease adaptor ClpS [Prolixibacteraceae bacterium]MBN2650233.1 ATP-dependent Clp protease adaptor ClpS [Prolixibacteraceae bacterium]